MSLFTVHVTIDQEQIDAEIRSALIGTMEEATVLVRDVWADKIRSAPGIWDVERTAYIKSLTMGPVIDHGASLLASVWTEYPVAEQIEHGRPARDLKKALNTSAKVRRTEAGKRFLVIPFRHNTPDHGVLAPDMPKAVYLMAKALKPTTVVRRDQRPAGQVMTFGPNGMRPSPNQSPFLSNRATKSKYLVTQSKYAWGGRLPQGLGKYSGMIKSDASTPKAKSSVYLTLRTMMEGSSDWIVPAKPAANIAKQTAEEVSPIVQRMIDEALARLS